jgi:hypothetical protein
MSEKPSSRRRFLAATAAGALGATVARTAPATEPQATPPPGAPSAFGTAPVAGPDVTPATFAEAGKLMRVEMTEKDRIQAAGNWQRSMAGLMERRTGPRERCRWKTASRPRPPGHLSQQWT